MKLRSSQSGVRRRSVRSGKRRRFAVIVVVGLSGCRWFDTLFGEGDQPKSTDRFVWRIEGHTNARFPWHDDSSVYFLGRQHQLTAVEKSSATVRWSSLLPVERVQTVGFGGVVRGDTLFVGDEDLFAISARDGRVLWRFDPVDGVDVGRWPPRLSGGLVIVGSSNGWVFAVDAANGIIRWSKRLGTVTQLLIYTAPVVDGTLYVTAVDFDSAENGQPQGFVGALDATNGALIWMRAVPRNEISIGATATIDPVVAGEVVVVGARDGPVYGFERATGALRWKMQPLVDPLQSGDLHFLSHCDGVIYVGSSSSTIVAALDAATGQERWRTPKSRGSPDRVSCDGRSVFVVRVNGGLEVLDATTGSKQWEIGYPDNDFWGGVVIDGDRVYGGGFRGLYALRYD